MNGLLRRPRNGEKIKLTWLPSARNAPGCKNAYIGMQGVVEDYAKDGFVLRGETSILFVSRPRKLRYELI